jgi:hypothetical protein
MESVDAHLSAQQLARSAAKSLEDSSEYQVADAGDRNDEQEKLQASGTTIRCDTEQVLNELHLCLL